MVKMSNVERVSILVYVLLTVLLKDIFCGNEVSTTSDLLISEKLSAGSDQFNRTLHVKYLPGLTMEVEGIDGFRLFWLRYPNRFENYFELRLFENSTKNKQMKGNHEGEISSTLWNCTQMDSCREVSRSSGIKLNVGSNSPVRIWFTFHGSFKAGLGVDLLSFRFLQFDPPSFLDSISHVSFRSSGSQSAVRIHRTPFINKCLILTNESRVAMSCGNELTDEAVCVSCGCCYNPDILPTTPCFKPIGNFDLMDHSQCAVPVSKVADNVQFRNNGPKCAGVNVTFTLTYNRRSYNILKLSFNVDFGDGVSFQDQRFLPSNDSVGLKTRRGYKWQTDHSYSEAGVYEAVVKYNDGVKSSDEVIAKTDVAVERAKLQGEEFFVIHDRPAIVGDAMTILILLRLSYEPLSILASVNDSKAVDKVVVSKSLPLPEWLEDSLDAELKSHGPLYEGMLKSMTINSGTEERSSIYQGLLRHVFTKAGDYFISFMITTVCGRITVNKTLSVHEGSKISFEDFVGDVDIVTNGSVAVHEVVGIVVSMQHFTKNTYVEIHLGDGSAVLTFLPARRLPLPLWTVEKTGTRADYSSVATSHRYTVGGKYRVQVIIEDVVLNQHISKIVDVEVTCYANLTFPGHAGPIAHPLNEAFLVRREIIQDCSSANPSEEWRIYKGTSLTSDNLPLPVNVEMRSRVGMVVPPYTLAPAVYTIEIQALIPLSKDSGHITISNQLQVEFVSAGILTNIKAPETHTLASDSVLTLDASNSKDLDDPAQSGFGLSFTWFCSTLNDFTQADPLSAIEGSSCYEAEPMKLPSTDAVLRYRTGHLFNKADIREIWFYVRVAKPGKRPSNATHSVRLLRSHDSPLSGGEPGPSEALGAEALDKFNPYAVIVCIQNCHKTIDPGQELELGILCVNCHMNDVLIYHWSLTIHGNMSADDRSPPTIDLEAAAKYGTDKSDVIVAPGTFEGVDTHEKCTISVTVTFPTKQEVTVGYDFSVLQPSDDEAP